MSEEKIEALLLDIRVAEGASHLEGEEAIDALAGRKRDERLKDWTN